MRYGRYRRLRHALALALVALFLPAVVLAQPRPIDTGYTIIDLMTLGGDEAFVYALNDRGQVAGQVAKDGVGYAFLWSAETGMVVLGESGPFQDREAIGINERGHVVSRTGMDVVRPKALAGDEGVLLYSEAIDVNEHGQVAGTTTGGSLPYAFLWSAETGMIDLGVSRGGFTLARDLNDQGQVVGQMTTKDLSIRAFVWGADTGVIDLGTFGGTESIAVAVNDQGQVIGGSETADRNWHAFLWSAETGMRDLGTLGGNGSGAVALNKHGQVVGVSGRADGQSHVFLWSAETGMRDLGTLGAWISPAAINDRGQVAGWGGLSDYGPVFAFFWSAETGMIDLGGFGGNQTAAGDLNEHGQVVGVSETAAGERRAFVWSAKTGMNDLGTLGGAESYAVAINERGQIAGVSADKLGRRHAVLWNPREQKLPGVKPAQISILLRPNPNRETRGDGIVTYTIEVVNRGEGNADNTFITLPLDPAKVRVLDAQMDHPGAWVSRLSSTMLQIETGLLSGGGDTMTATLRLVTTGDIPDGSVIDQRLEYRWEDEAGGGSGSSNHVTLTKGSSDLSQAVYPLVAEEMTDPAGGTLHFSSAIFAPNEVVAVWFNQPDGTVREGGSIRADSEGMISVPVTLTDFAPGFYGIVARGSWTEFTALGSFEVR